MVGGIDLMNCVLDFRRPLQDENDFYPVIVKTKLAGPPPTKATFGLTPQFYFGFTKVQYANCLGKQNSSQGSTESRPTGLKCCSPPPFFCSHAIVRGQDGSQIILDFGPWH
jgi:hypothetical protein